MSNKIGGIVHAKVDGKKLAIKAEIEYNLGLPKRTSVMGHDGVHGYTEEPQAAFISGVTTDNKNLTLKDFLLIDGATIIAELANGKKLVGSNMYNVSEGNVNTKEGEIAFRFESTEKIEEMK